MPKFSEDNANGRPAQESANESDRGINPRWHAAWRGYTFPMLRRQLIRSCLISLLSLCIAAWVASYFWQVEGESVGKTRVWALEAVGGGLELSTGENHRSGYSPPLSVGWQPASAEYVSVRYESCELHWGGFGWNHWAFRGVFRVLIPLWLPTTLAALLLWFAWRKTKPKAAGRAFPIEPTVKAK
jgi:hypothetical protein